VYAVSRLVACRLARVAEANSGQHQHKEKAVGLKRRQTLSTPTRPNNADKREPPTTRPNNADPEGARWRRMERVFSPFSPFVTIFYTNLSIFTTFITQFRKFKNQYKNPPVVSTTCGGDDRDRRKTKPSEVLPAICPSNKNKQQQSCSTAPHWERAPCPTLARQTAVSWPRPGDNLRWRTLLCSATATPQTLAETTTRKTGWISLWRQRCA